jgi:hypothetical protein
MSKVKCRVCTHSDGKKCLIKQEKVAQNKSRRCDFFEHNAEKIQIKTKVRSQYIPYHMTSRKAYKAYKKQQTQEVLQQAVEEKVEKLSSPDILSRFRSNAE